MKAIPGLLAVCLVSGITTMAGGQATTVQQPVFQFFSTGTTVTVPDQGSALLGGTKSARVGSTSRSVPVLGRLPGVGRLFNNRAIGGEFSNSTNYANVTIIDHREWDEAILNGARQPGGFGSASLDPVQQRARFLTRHTGRRPHDTRTGLEDPMLALNAGAPAPGAVVRQSPSLYDRRSTPPQRQASPARRYLAMGDAAMADGKLELAKRYYTLAEQQARRPDGNRVTARTADRQRQDAALVLRAN